MTTNEFNPSRLTLARKRRGMSKKMLAEELDVSARIITAYEAGERQPKPKSIEAIAEFLDFPVPFFNKNDADSLPIEGTSFRSLTKTTARLRDQALAAGELALELSDWIGKKFANLPDPKIPKLQGVDAETAATIIRQEWGLGELSIRNLVHLLEDKGVKVFSLAEQCQDIDAFSCWHKNRPYIFLNTMKTAERSRMDAAHELGHLVLHWHDIIPRNRDIEHEAKLFAAAFLMPKSGILANVPYGASLDQLIEIKHDWGVSLLALIVRAFKVSLLSEWQYRSYCKAIGRKNELEAMKQRETSLILSKVFKMLRDEGITKADVAHSLLWPISELNKLIFGLTITAIEGDGEKIISGGKKPDLRIVF